MPGTMNVKEFVLVTLVQTTQFFTLTYITWYKHRRTSQHSVGHRLYIIYNDISIYHSTYKIQYYVHYIITLVAYMYSSCGNVTESQHGRDTYWVVSRLL